MPQILIKKLSYFSLLDDENNRGFPLTSAGNKSYKVLTIKHEKLIWSNKPTRSGLKKKETSFADWYRAHWSSDEILSIVWYGF